MKREASRSAGLVKDTRGAVLAEFVVAILPLCTVFFVMVQLSALAAAKLMVKHATVIAARAAAVYSNAGDNLPDGTGDGKTEITNSVRAALGTWNPAITGLTVDVADSSNREDPYNLVTVTVTATYTCGVPLGKIICGTGFTKTLVDTKSMPHQGARYRK